MTNDAYHEITDDPDILHKYIDYDVYYKRDSYMGLYKKKGVPFDTSRMSSGKLPERLFVSLKDRIYQVRDQTRRLNERLVNEIRKDPVKAKKRLSELVAITLSEPRTEVLEDMRNTIGIVVEEYLNYPDVVKNLVQVSSKDYTTQLHLTNVMLFCLAYANCAGYGEEDLKLFGLIGLLHDVGKVDVPDDILTAPRKLTDEEFERIKQHPRNGWKMLRKCEFDKIVPVCALEHHERTDGSGYPDGKMDGELCDFSKTLAIADVYEAITNWRPYKEPIAPLDALRIMKTDIDAEKLDRAIFSDFARSIVGLTQ